MILNVSTDAAQRYGLAGATLLGYLQSRYEDNHDMEGRFTAPWKELNKELRFTRETLDRQRNRLEQEGLIKITRLPNLTLYQLNHEAIASLTGEHNG